MKVVLLNGPARSGKDTLAQFLVREFAGAVRIGFADHLKRLAHVMCFGPAGWDMDPNAFDGTKEAPREAFAGMSPRQFYIHVSERVCKPLFGGGYFGDRFVDAARASGADLVVVPDSGFRREAERVVEAFGASNVLLVRLSRDGFTFEGDSRDYIVLSDLDVAAVEIENVTGRPEIASAALDGALTEWLYGDDA